ncbi:15684_t:CDS:1, partial [Gigaspora margarita]
TGNTNKIDIDNKLSSTKPDLQVNLTLWNLLLDSRFAKIRRCFSHFDKILLMK